MAGSVSSPVGPDDATYGMHPYEYSGRYGGGFDPVLEQYLPGLGYNAGVQQFENLPWSPDTVSPVYTRAAMGGMGALGQIYNQMADRPAGTTTRDNRTFGQTWRGAYQFDPSVTKGITSALGQPADTTYSDLAENQLYKLASAFARNEFNPGDSGADKQAKTALAQAIAGQRSAAVSARGINPALASRMAQQGAEQERAKLQASMPMLRAQEYQNQMRQAIEARQLAGTTAQQAGTINVDEQAARDRLTQAFYGRLSEADKARLSGTIGYETARQGYENMRLGIPSSLMGGATQLTTAAIGAPSMPGWVPYVSAGLGALGSLGASIASNLGGQTNPSPYGPNSSGFSTYGPQGGAYNLPQSAQRQ